MKIIVLIIVISIWITQCDNECQPYYPRIFWNPEATEISPLRIDHIFMWNTNNSCPFSYIKVTVSDSIFQYKCT